MTLSTKKLRRAACVHRDLYSSFGCKLGLFHFRDKFQFDEVFVNSCCSDGSLCVEYLLQKNPENAEQPQQQNTVKPDKADTVS